MKCFVLCGGEGTRLRPYTYTTPKPMLEIAGKPILQYVIENLKRNGINDLVLTVGYLNEQIRNYFGDGKKFGVSIEYCIEEKPKNTAGSIVKYKGKVNETFCVVMGDHISSIKLKEMIDYHKKNRPIATIGLVNHRIPLEYGVVKLNAKGEVEQFVEKPLIDNQMNIAMYVFEPKIFDYIDENEDFARDVFPKIMKKGERKDKIMGYSFADDAFFDVGRISDYENMNELFRVIKMIKALNI